MNLCHSCLEQYIVSYKLLKSAQQKPNEYNPFCATPQVLEILHSIVGERKKGKPQIDRESAVLFSTMHFICKPPLFIQNIWSMLFTLGLWNNLVNITSF